VATKLELNKQIVVEYNLLVDAETAVALRMLFEFLQPDDLRPAIQRAGKLGTDTEKRLTALFQDLRKRLIEVVPL
jgi:hypothetical protein